MDYWENFVGQEIGEVYLNLLKDGKFYTNKIEIVADNQSDPNDFIENRITIFIDKNDFITKIKMN